MALLYRYPTPEIELSLVSGGTLATGTTYYFTARYYGQLFGHSPLSIQSGITTDTTNLSIRVKIKYWNGATYDYNKPTTSFYASNTTYYQIIWDSVDLTDGLGNYIFRKYPNQIALVSASNTTYDVTYTTPPVKAHQPYTYIPELYSYSDPILPIGWSKTQGHPIVYANSASDTWDNMNTALISDTGFTNYLISKSNFVDTMASYYMGYTGVTQNDIQLTSYYGAIISLGTHNRCVFSTIDSGNIGGSGSGISINKGDDTILRGTKYRQGFSINGNNNSIYAFNGQVSISTNDSTKRKFISCMLLTNGMNDNNNISMYNSYIYHQWMANNEVISNLYQYTDTGITTYTADFTIYNGFDNTVKSYTINNYSIDTNRATSEGINYSEERKPRIQWSVAQGTYVNKTIIFNNLLDVYITDNLNVSINSAKITLSNAFETITGNTNANGYIQNYIKIRTAVMDSGYTTTTYFTNWVDNIIVDVKIEKTGYESYNAKVNLLNTKLLNISLKSISSIRKDIDGNIYKAISPEIGSSSNMIKL